MGRGNKRGGKKHKKNKNETYETKILRLKEDGQEYAQVTNCKGNCRFDVKCCDGKDRAAILCGAMRKKKFIGLRDIVLVSLRDFQDSVCDIIDSYDDNQSRKLKEEKHIPELFKLEEENPYDGEHARGLEFSNAFPSSSEEEEELSNDIDLDDI